MKRRGYLGANTPFIVRSYRAARTDFRDDVPNLGRPYSIHFYPGMNSLLVVGRQKTYGH